MPENFGQFLLISNPSSSSSSFFFFLPNSVCVLTPSLNFSKHNSYIYYAFKVPSNFIANESNPIFAVTLLISLAFSHHFSSHNSVSTGLL